MPHTAREHPTLRVHFLCPDGNPQHSAWHSTWADNELRDMILENPNSPQAQALIIDFTAALQVAYDLIGCRITHIEVFGTLVRELI